MTPSRSILVWTALLSLLFSIASAVALPDNDDHKRARHETKTITVTTTSVQTCSTPKSFGTTSSQSSIPSSCPSLAAQITKTVTASSTVTITSRQAALSTATDPKTITVTKTDTVTSVLSGSKGAITTVSPSTVTVTKTVASNAIALASTNTVTVTVSQSGTARTVTSTISASANIVTLTQTLPQSSLTTTVTTTASGSASTITVTSDIATAVTSDIATTVAATTTIAPSAACPNILTNPGFESGTTGWTFSQANPGISFETVPSSSIPGGAHSGASAGAFVSNGGPFLPGTPSDIYQTLANIPAVCGTSGKYQVTGYVKTVSNQCYINIFNEGRSGQPILSFLMVPGGSDPPWNGLTVTVDAPLTGLPFVTFDAVCNTQDPVWFDDISVVPIS